MLERSGLEPELGGLFQEAILGAGGYADDRTGFEPELGGDLRQKGVYVDEITCIGCKHCAHVAPNTFFIEQNYGRSRVYRQDGDPEEIIDEAIDTCPVNCIHWLDYTELKKVEKEREYQVIPVVGFPVQQAMISSHQQKRRSGGGKEGTGR
jgi:ferredoxin